MIASSFGSQRASLEQSYKISAKDDDIYGKSLLAIHSNRAFVTETELNGSNL